MDIDDLRVVNARDGYRAGDAMIDRKVIDRRSFDEGIEGLRRWSDYPSATLWYYVCWAEGICG